MCQNLKQLTPVKLSEVWETEPQHFTPWLAKEENLTLLGKTLGIGTGIGGKRNKHWETSVRTSFVKIQRMIHG